MIDAEKLLGKVLSSGISGFKKGKKKKHKKHKKSDDMMSGLLGGLTSGKGLITAIGLGVGAYEILKNKPSSQTGTIQPPPLTPAVPPPPTPPSLPQTTAVPPPPPIPGQQTKTLESPEAPKNNEDIAIRLIQTMVASAYADGKMDHEEEAQILGKMQEQELTSEEKQFLLAELHSPKSITEITAGIDEPLIAQTMYTLAVSTVIIDTPEERQWLDELAQALSISDNVKNFIEAEM